MMFCGDTDGIWDDSARQAISDLTEGLMISVDTVFPGATDSSSSASSVVATFTVIDTFAAVVDFRGPALDADDAAVVNFSHSSEVLRFQVVERGSDMLQRDRSRTIREYRLSDTLAHLVATEMIRQRKPWIAQVHSLLSTISSDAEVSSDFQAMSMAMSNQMGFFEGLDLVEPVASRIEDLFDAGVPVEWYIESIRDDLTDLIGVPDE